MTVELDRKCDFCGRQAVVDCKGVGGRPWAYCCESHRRIWSVGGDQPCGEHPLETQLALPEPKPTSPSSTMRAFVPSETLDIIDGWIEKGN